MGALDGHPGDCGRAGCRCALPARRALADAGAEVIEIERPEGDFARGHDAAAKGQSSYFVWLNRGKQSAVVDLATKESCAELEKLIAQRRRAHSESKPGSMDKLSFSRERLLKDYPKLISCTITGYGDEGPYAHRKAYDLLIQAESGLASITGNPDGASRVGMSIVDVATSATAHAAILEALIARGRTGKGADIRISMFDVMADWCTVPLLNSEAGNPPKRMGLRHPSIAPYGVFTSKDGKDILISIQSEREWKTLCAKVLDQPDLPPDPRVASMVERVRNRDFTDKTGRRHLRQDDARRAAEAAVGCRHRLCRGQHHGRPHQPSASAPHRGRHAERPRQLSRAGADHRRRDARLRRRARHRRTIPIEDVTERGVMTEKLDIDHLAAMDRPQHGGHRHRHRAAREGSARDAVPGGRRAQEGRRRAVHGALVPGAAGVSDVDARARRPSDPRRLPAAGAAAAPDVGRRRDRVPAAAARRR